MISIKTQPRGRLILLAGAAAITLSGCSQPLDLDLRGLAGGFSTAKAAETALASRPKPDDRGVISYPNYQVAVARRGDTLRDVAARVSANAAELAKFNGIAIDANLQRGEVIALPKRVAEPSPETGAVGTGPIQPVDITALANGAIDRVPATPGVQTAPLSPAPQTGQEPVRHKVQRGESAYTVSRLYKVPVKALAEWNGLNADFTIREGQFLLIPVARQNPPKRAQPAKTAEPLPGEGSKTPTPPSAIKPLPNDKTAKPIAAAAATTAVVKPVADIGKPTKPTRTTKMTKPVNGTIIREYAKGKNEGIDIQAAPGSSVKVAQSGTVAAITKSAEGVPIIVVRHPGNLLTVYANVDNVSVTKGDAVKRGQNIAKLRSGNNAYVHFEVRKGFESVDPSPFIN